MAGTMVPTKREFPNTRHLPVVDIYEDPGIWVCLDEGCSSNCHGELRGQTTDHKLSLMTTKCVLDFQWLHKRSKHFDGIGTERVKTKGKRLLPTCMKLKNSGLLLPNFVESHEQAGNTRYCCHKRRKRSWVSVRTCVRGRCASNITTIISTCIVQKEQV